MDQNKLKESQREQKSELKIMKNINCSGFVFFVLSSGSSVNLDTWIIYQIQGEPEKSENLSLSHCSGLILSAAFHFFFGCCVIRYERSLI